MMDHVRKIKKTKKRRQEKQGTRAISQQGSEPHQHHLASALPLTLTDQRNGRSGPSRPQRHQPLAERRAHTAVLNTVVDHDAGSHWVRVRPRRRAQVRIVPINRKKDDGRRVSIVCASAVVVPGRAQRKTPDWLAGERETKALPSTRSPSRRISSATAGLQTTQRMQTAATTDTSSAAEATNERRNRKKQCTQCLPATDTNAALPLSSTPRTIQVCEGIPPTL